MIRVASHVLALAATAAVIALPTGTAAQDTLAVEVEEDREEAEEENPFRDFERLVRGAEVSPGFFDLYTKAGRLYLAVPADRLGQEFLMDTRVAQGIGAAGLFAGTTISTFEMDLMAFEKRGENVLLVQRPHRFGAESDDRAALAVSVSVGSSVVQSADVEAIRPDSALVLDVTGWFLSDLSGMAPIRKHPVSEQNFGRCRWRMRAISVAAGCPSCRLRTGFRSNSRQDR